MIGILDWGIGGFGFQRALRRAQPSTRVVYLSDSGFTPYGKVPAARLRARVREVLACMREYGATHVVVACHAASTVLPSLGVRGLSGEVDTRSGSVEVTGIIAHALAEVRRKRLRHVAIIGGSRTIRSRAYADGLRAPGIVVQSRIAQPLSAHVERGALDTPALHRDLRAILRPLRDTPALLLACTHYPALTQPIQSYLPDTQLLDPVDSLCSWVSSSWPTTSSARRDTLLTTGDPAAMQASARAAFGVRIAMPTRITLRQA